MPKLPNGKTQLNVSINEDLMALFQEVCDYERRTQGAQLEMILFFWLYNWLNENKKSAAVKNRLEKLKSLGFKGLELPTRRKAKAFWGHPAEEGHTKAGNE
jgi:sugar phosphate isomerase/epimerase